MPDCPTCKTCPCDNCPSTCCGEFGDYGKTPSFKVRSQCAAWLEWDKQMWASAHSSRKDILPPQSDGRMSAELSALRCVYRELTGKDWNWTGRVRDE